MSIEIVGRDVGQAWVRATRHVLDSGEVFHLLVRILGDGDSNVQASLDALLQASGRQSVETVANTVFPSLMARSCDGHAELAGRYLQIYPKLKGVRQNSRGTYFGRMIAYPTSEGDIDQLGTMISKLRKSVDGQGLTSCYEISIISPSKDVNMRMQFPCLSYISLHLQRSQILHMFASYRNHYMVERAYGNYLGLRRLQHYIAGEVGIEVGELAVLSGHATIDASKTATRAIVDSYAEDWSGDS